MLREASVIVAAVVAGAACSQRSSVAPEPPRSASAARAPSLTGLRIDACRLCPLGDCGAPDDEFELRLLVSTDEEGRVAAIGVDAYPEKRAPGRPSAEAIRSCLRAWRLPPSADFTVSASSGSEVPPTWRIAAHDGIYVEVVDCSRCDEETGWGRVGSRSHTPLSPERLPNLSIISCPIWYPRMLRMASVRDAEVTYVLTSDENGQVVDVAVDPESKFPPELHPVFAPMEACLMRWKLGPSTQTTVTLRWGSLQDVVWTLRPAEGSPTEVRILFSNWPESGKRGP